MWGPNSETQPLRVLAAWREGWACADGRPGGPGWEGEGLVRGAAPLSIIPLAHTALLLSDSCPSSHSPEVPGSAHGLIGGGCEEERTGEGVSGAGVPPRGFESPRLRTGVCKSPPSLPGGLAVEGTRLFGDSCFSELPDLLVKSHEAYMEFGFRCPYTVIGHSQAVHTVCGGLSREPPGPRSLEYLLSGTHSPAL